MLSTNGETVFRAFVVRDVSCVPSGAREMCLECRGEFRIRVLLLLLLCPVASLFVALQNPITAPMLSTYTAWSFVVRLVERVVSMFVEIVSGPSVALL